MAKKRERKSTKKDSQLIIRIKKEERDLFIDLCDELDTSAAREIRLFIRSFLDRHEDLIEERLSSNEDDEEDAGEEKDTA